MECLVILPAAVYQHVSESNAGRDVRGEIKMNKK